MSLLRCDLLLPPQGGSPNRNFAAHMSTEDLHAAAVLPFDKFAASLPAHAPAPAPPSAASGGVVVPRGGLIVFIGHGGGPLQVAQLVHPTTTAAPLSEPLRLWKWRSDTWHWHGFHERVTKYAPTNAVVYPHNVNRVVLYYCPPAALATLRFAAEVDVPQDVIAYASAVACREAPPAAIPQFAMPPAGAPAWRGPGGAPLMNGGFGPAPVAGFASCAASASLVAAFGGAPPPPATALVRSFRKQLRSDADAASPAEDATDEDEDDVCRSGCGSQAQDAKNRTPLGSLSGNLPAAACPSRPQPRHPGELARAF